MIPNICEQLENHKRPKGTKIAHSIPLEEREGYSSIFEKMDLTKKDQSQIEAELAEAMVEDTKVEEPSSTKEDKPLPDKEAKAAPSNKEPKPSKKAKKEAPKKTKAVMKSHEEMFEGPDTEDEGFDPKRRRDAFRFQYGYNGDGIEAKPDIRARKVFLIDKGHRICPKLHYKMYMYQLDETLRLHDEITYANDRMANLISRIYRYHGYEPPPISEKAAIKNKRYIQVVNAFHEIKKKLKKLKKPPEENEFNHLIAALEIVGTIIMVPDILNQTFARYGDEENEDYLWTDTFVTKWTNNLINKISWPMDQAGVWFHSMQRTKKLYFHEGENE